MYYLGYNTNGMAHHALDDAVRLLSDAGYRGIAVTLDHNTLNPMKEDFIVKVGELRDMLRQLNMKSVIETGARFLLDPRHKHEPTLVTANPRSRGKRIDFLCRTITAAKALGSDCVSIWSGVPQGNESEEVLFARLLEGLQEVIEYATLYDVIIGFEPEPGMFIETTEQYAKLRDALGSDRFRLTLDIGHLFIEHNQPDRSPEEVTRLMTDTIKRFAGDIVNVHVDDILGREHFHLPLGRGDIDFAPVLKAISDTGYDGGVYVELSRNSHEAPEMAQHAFGFLKENGPQV